MSSRRVSVVAILVTAGVLGGCGGSPHRAAPGAAAPGSTATPAGTASGSGAAGPGALSADALSAATGDIPDNQVFLTFAARSAGFSIKYPEGWTRSGPPARSRSATRSDRV